MEEREAFQFRRSASCELRAHNIYHPPNPAKMSAIALRRLALHARLFSSSTMARKSPFPCPLSLLPSSQCF